MITTQETREERGEAIAKLQNQIQRVEENFWVVT
jgi:hypothetical protein